MRPSSPLRILRRSSGGHPSLCVLVGQYVTNGSHDANSTAHEATDWLERSHAIHW